MVATFLNFTVFVILLVYFLKKPAVAMVRNRHIFIRDEIQSTQKLYGEAKAEFEEFTSKLSGVDSEMNAVFEQSQLEAKTLHAQLLSAAESAAHSIEQDADAASKGIYRELKQELLQDLGRQVVGSARERVQNNLTQELKVRLQEDFSKEVAS